MKNLGDKVYLAWADDNLGEEKDCPVCSGKKEIHIILGDESRVAVPCGNCTYGAGTLPTGRVTRHGGKVGVTPAKVTGIESYGGEIKYSYHPRVYQEIGVFDTEEEAKAAAEKELPRVKESAEKREAHISMDKWSSASWSVGYHRKEIRDAKRSIAWHETQLREVK